MKLINPKDFAPKPKDHWLDLTQGMSGHFAVEMWLNPDMGGFPEPWDSGIGRYETAKEAWEEAKIWAKESEIPLINHPEFEVAQAPKSDFENWLDQMDSQQPSWWLDFAQPSELVPRFNALRFGGRSIQDVERSLRDTVGKRLFVCIRAWVSLEICPICQEPVVLAKRLSAERGAPLRVEETSK